MIREHWLAIEQDLQDIGVDCGNREVMARSWRWLEARIQGLLGKPPSYDLMGNPHFATRVQSALSSPPPAAKAKSA